MPSEFELIQSFADMLGAPKRALLGIGDDTAVLPVEPNSRWLVASDMLIEDVHFRRQWSSLEDVGWKALAVNISDVAAMGGLPRYATVSLGLPSSRDAAPLYRGLSRCAATFDVEIVGGDTVYSPRLVLNVSIIGESAGMQPVTRAGARPGDIVCVTGSLGGAGAGLEILRRGESIAHPLREAVIALHRRPLPRVAAGRLLARSGATAMLDISDGLAGDAAHIATNSGVAIVLHAEQIPIHPGAVSLADGWGVDPLELALFGGEDFELLAILPESSVSGAEQDLASIGVPLTVIGFCEAGRDVWLLQNSERRRLDRGGFDHFRS